MDKYLGEKILGKDIGDNTSLEDSQAYKDAISANLDQATLLINNFILDKGLTNYITVNNIAGDLKENIAKYLLFYSVEEAKNKLNNTFDKIFNLPLFMGCYQDADNRDLPTYLGVYTLEEGAKIAREREFKYFAMQYPQIDNMNGKAEVWAGNTYGKHGEVDCSNSLKYNDMNMGNIFINAVYKVV